MKNFKRITAAALAGVVLSVPVYADYEFGNLKKFYSFEDYKYEQQNGKQYDEPDGFVYTSGSFRSSKGYFVDPTRKSKTFKLPGKDAETTLKFGTIVDSGKLHLSYDVYQSYTGNADASKARSITMMLSRNATAAGNGWYHGALTSNAVFDQYDPEAIKFDSDAYQHILELSRMTVKDNDFENPQLESKGPIFYYNGAGHWAGKAVADPTKVVDWGKWYKLDIYFDKDENTYDVYLDGEKLNGQAFNLSSNSYDADIYPGTLLADDKYKAIKGVVFRTVTANMFNGSRGNIWHVNNDGYFLLDNVYVKQYTGDTDIISLATDDATGNGVALSGGTLNVAYSEYMASPAAKSDVTIKNTLTGENVTDFEISNSDGMQFVVNFGSTPLAPGQYEVSVSNIKGKITNANVALPAYFNTVRDNKAWVDNIECLRVDGTVLERGSAVSSATTALKVTFTEAVDMTDENAASFFRLESGGNTQEISKAKIDDDGKSVTLYPENLFLPGSEIELNVLDTVTTKSGTSFVSDGGIVAKEVISIANDPLCSYGQEFEYDSDNKTAEFSVNVVKSDTSEIKYTMVAASYKDVEDKDGNKVTELMDVKYIPIAIDADERVLKEYSIDAINCDGADRVKAFIWEYPSFKKVYMYEQDL